ncbi:MAG: hypothetical protein WD751_10290 [Anaerolineales bacterium]
MVNRGLLSQLNLPVRMQRNLVWGLLIAAALIAFEAFNFSTTEFAMRDLLGDLRFGGLAWATILALAFCFIDFAGIAHMFSNGTNLKAKQGLEVWYLFAAWLLAATMNAILTWWGISVAIVNHASLGNALLGRETLLAVVPAFVAVLVWLIRVLVIGTLITAGGKLFASESSAQRYTAPTMRRNVPAQSGRAVQPAMYQGLVPQSKKQAVDQGEY